MEQTDIKKVVRVVEEFKSECMAEHHIRSSKDNVTAYSKGANCGTWMLRNIRFKDVSKDAFRYRVKKDQAYLETLDSTHKSIFLHGFMDMLLLSDRLGEKIKDSGSVE